MMMSPADHPFVTKPTPVPLGSVSCHVAREKRDMYVRPDHLPVPPSHYLVNSLPRKMLAVRFINEGSAIIDIWPKRVKLEFVVNC